MIGLYAFFVRTVVAVYFVILSISQLHFGTWKSNSVLDCQKIIGDDDYWVERKRHTLKRKKTH